MTHVRSVIMYGTYLQNCLTLRNEMKLEIHVIIDNIAKHSRDIWIKGVPIWDFCRYADTPILVIADMPILPIFSY